MSRVYIGMELGSSRCWGAAKDEVGNLLSHGRLQTTEEDLVGFVKGYEQPKVLMEECDMAAWARKVLLPHAEVVVADPRRNAWIYKDSRKSDKIDARKLAEIARLGAYHAIWHTDDARMEELYLAVKTYERLRADVVRQKNRIHAKLRAQGIMTPGGKVLGKRGRQEALARLSPALRELLVADYELLDFLVRMQAGAHARFVRMGRGIPVVRALQEIPGVGPVTAPVFCAYVKDPRRFSRGSRLMRFCRLGITESESAGKRLKREHLDPRGHGALKGVSHMAYLGAMRTKDDNRFQRAYRASLAETGNATHARLNVQRKLLATMLAMWKDGTRYDDDDVSKKRV